MNLLVTGGLGYLGFEVVTAASRQSDVAVVTLGRSPVPDGFPLPENATHEVGSVLDGDRVREVLEKHRISHIVHAAGARTSQCAKDPLLAVESNVLSTDTLFRIAKSVPSVEKVLFISTAAVYGKVAHEIDESHPVSPRTNYAVAKVAAELAAEGHAADADFRSIIVRPGFVIGPSSSGAPNRAKLADFIRQAMTEPAVEMHFANRFFVSLASEVGEALVTLLSMDSEESASTFHLPGCPLTISGFAAILKGVVAEHGRTPQLRTSIDESLEVPGNLSFSRFEVAVGKRYAPDLGAMIREVIDATE